MLVDFYDFVVLYISDILGADDVQGTRFRRHHVGIAPFMSYATDTQRTEAVGVASGVQCCIGEHHQ